jgi:hypothetical protein
VFGKVVVVTTSLGASLESKSVRPNWIPKSRSTAAISERKTFDCEFDSLGLKICTASDMDID